MIRFQVTIAAFLVFLFCLVASCATTSGGAGPEVPKGDAVPNPGGESEAVINEDGDEVKITTLDPAFFQAASKDKEEYFRVFITSESYKVRQIRGAKYIRRKVDKGGDALISEELVKYNKINYSDDGIIIVILNGNTGAVETIRFNTRVPRINDLAKIIQNDVTRWSMEHSEEKPVVTKYQIFYSIKLENKSGITRDNVKDELKKEVIKRK
ncbi:hypothetical protein EHQ27_10185 [Leptospira wolffii]|uniref:Lipoprotein n=1 Tax=Leptospira wolffii TaxID=409998 RepID=A0A2M9Z9J0_9LEPT|nr:hypothetical protein [Leptospira wolffii]PJZ65106.1 hypothetical protein CH371_14360 [Leptospira wolffii]TGK56766.1 hypothetical protein EHQ32_14345 [Leptospira wolffii]TGK71652.1 hypothetical protein EHQ27_10185 [Leptospira wolffii]TGK75491.1 hypothetical protein EHQ35_03720 [Leptospira wolffii]TGL33019.1 hypothetical protein EHQ57_00810 [Leptospira wolffii]